MLCWPAFAGLPSPANQGSGVAFQVLDLRTGRVISSSNDEVIERPSLPGSTMKLPALIAALESGTISPSTRIACPGVADVNGRRIACLHPRVRRPLTPSEALSYSCNTFFATVGARLPRARMDGVLSSLGLPPTPAGAPMALVAAGLVATSVAPSSLLRAFVQVIGEPPGLAMSSSTRAVVVEGLRGAAVFGTAGAFSARGVEALAKTGTANAPGGGTLGVVLAAWPAVRPERAVVLLVAGGAGQDAAERAASIARDGRATWQDSGPARATEAPRPQPVAPPASADPSALTLRVGFASSRGYDVRGLGLEDYVARVLAGEAAPRSAPAALEALAVTVRTFALANRGRHGRDGFDLCDLTHCQVLREPYAAARAAAAATAGLVLAWQGAPASVYYTASCGGVGERPSNVWPGAPDPPFLPSRRDSGCAGEPPWSAEIQATDITRALVAAGFRGREVREVRVRSRSASGRVLSLGVPGMTPDEISGQALRMAVGRALGWQLIKSTDFQVKRASRGYRFTGRGFGHGVGFCVIGATRRAAAGASRAALLTQYFPGAQVVPLSAELLRPQVTPPADPAVPLASGDAVGVGAPLSRSIAPAPSTSDPPAAAAAPARGTPAPPPVGDTPAGLSVTLPSADERDRSYVTAVAERALAAAAARVGKASPSSVRLVFHPTVEAFTRETGESWWSAASTSGSRIDLQPSSVLRARGELEATIAHETGHVVTGPALANRARWVQEGAAMFAAGAITPQEITAARRLGPPSGCPADAALARPASAAAAKDAYARARECFARALATNSRWDEIR
jgi:SpoIID/LytB domain protein